MTKRILIPLAPGFEEIEAVTLVDVLRRAGLEVILAGLQPGALEGARGVRVEVDTTLAQVDLGSFDAIILPGGMGGTRALMESERLLAGLRAHHGSGRLIGAICAAPMVLERAGLLEGVEVTSHPSVRAKLGAAVVLDEPRVVQSGQIWTSQGAGTAMEFALALVAELCGEAERAQVAAGLVA